MKTILLKFAGPLQSWGTDSKFETRYTDRYPSKSGVLGLISASLGLERDNDKGNQRLNELDFAVRIDQTGELLHDYQSARRYTKKGIPFKNPYITNRYYLQDAVFAVAIGHKDEQWMDEIEDALKHPYYQPFLGRRSNPLTADFFIGTTNEDAVRSLEQLAWQAAPWFKKKNSVEKLTIYADADLISQGSSTLIRDRVVSFSQKERKHGFRPIKRKYIPVIDHKIAEEHNAFDGF